MASDTAAESTLTQVGGDGGSTGHRARCNV